MNLKYDSYSFFWPKAGDEYDGMIMDREEFQRRIEASEADSQDLKYVVATLLPGIRRISACSSDRRSKEVSMKSECNLDPQDSRSRGKVILPALVYLRNSDTVS